MRDILLVTVLLIFAIGCKKPTNEPPKDPEKPQQTRTGADILWCKVNGEPHLYKGKPTTGNHNGVHVYQFGFADSSVFIQVRAEDAKYSDGMNMYINVTMEAANIPLVNKDYNISDNLPYMYSEYYTGNGSNSYRVDTNSSYIRFTRVDNIVAAGVFEYHGVNKDKDSVHITEGFFDIVRE